MRLAELAEPDSYVAADDDRTSARLDDDHLHPACVTRRRDEPEAGKQLELAVDRHVPYARRLDPFELATLDVDRPAVEKVVAAELG